MRLSDGLALHLNPLFFRVLLALTFLWAGTGKFQSQEFTGEAAKTLIDLGIATAPAPSAPAAEGPEAAPPPEAPDDAGDAGESTPGDEGQDSAGDPDTNDTDQPEANGNAGISDTDQSEANGNAETSEADESETADELENGESEQPESTGEESTERAAEPVQEVDVSTLKVQARGMHNITLMLHNANHPRPALMAWIAACTEVGGAVLLLVGLFSRVWGLGLFITMAYAFYLTTWPAYTASLSAQSGVFPMTLWGGLMDMHFNVAKTGFFQLALGFMALSIFLSGPGGFSIDRMIFRRRSDGPKLISELEDE